MCTDNERRYGIRVRGMRIYGKHPLRIYICASGPSDIMPAIIFNLLNDVDQFEVAMEVIYAGISRIDYRIT
jgi:hypothetical protein